jgi:hypothetical protein
MGSKLFNKAFVRIYSRSCFGSCCEAVSAFTVMTRIYYEHCCGYLTPDIQVLKK